VTPPNPTPPPRGAWSKKNGLGPFNPNSHFCGHCKGEIQPGDKLWFKRDLVLCTTCTGILFPQYRN
jgi:hypothetical protein